MNILSRIILIFAVLASFSACRSKKVVVNNTTDIVNVEVKPSGDVLKSVDSIQSHYSDYKTLSLKFTSEYLEGEKSMEIKGLMKIKRDSFIWISIRPALGIELARILLTTDSVKIVDRINQEYFLGDYSFFEKKMNVKLNYSLVQAILTDEFTVYPYKEVENSNLLSFELLDTVPNPILQNNFFYKDENIIQQTFFRKSDYKIISNLINFKTSKRLININFIEFQLFNNKLFPTKLSANFKSTDKTLILNLLYEKVTFDAEVSSSFNISNNYKPMSFEKK